MHSTAKNNFIHNEMKSELVDLERAMKDWSVMNKSQSTYGERSVTIKNYYNIFFRKRFYFVSSLLRLL